MKSSAPILEMKKITKSFPGVLALNNVDFSLYSGEIHCLMGENGAGKSTLIKVLTGVYRRNAGDIIFDGNSLDLKAPYEAPLIGISTVYQEINLIPGLSVAENIYLGRQPKNTFGIDIKKIEKGARKALARLDIDIDVKMHLGDCSIAMQQMIAISRALDIEAKILVLDEPTSSLDAKESEHLFSVLRKLRDQGLAILFITHFLEQVYAVSDKITVLRNGDLIGCWKSENLSKLELVAAMIGKKVDPMDKSKIVISEKNKKRNTDGSLHSLETTDSLTVSSLGKKGVLDPVDIKLGRGEIVGLAGLLGSGRTEFARLLFGLDRKDSGSCMYNSKELKINDPHDAIAHGFAFCPEDRKEEGVFGTLSLRDNIALAIQGKRGVFKPLSRKLREQLADKYIKMLGIKTPGNNQLIRNLSGGNQQKAILARWMASDPFFLILDEPTRGIDVNAKDEIQKLMIGLKNSGMGILFISSELSEVARTSDRIAIMRDRRKVAEVSGTDIDESKIIGLIAEGASK